MESNPRPLKILMISPQFLPLLGGYERACQRLSKTLVHFGHHVTVVTERRERHWRKSEVLEGVRVERLWCLFKPRLHSITSFLSFVSYFLLHGRKFDVWHVHQYGTLAAAAIATGKLLGCPVVLKLTSSGKQGIAAVAAASPFPQLVGALMRRADAVIALTKETEKEARDFGIADLRIHRLGNGVETGKFHPLNNVDKEKMKTKLNLTGNLVIFVGRLAEEKNPDGLLRAWQICQESLSNDWRLILVGNGKMHERLRRLAQDLGLTNTVLFAGSQNNIEQWLGCADIYVTTSHREGLSNTLLEAMASGLPIVATRVSGVAELVEETGAGFVADTASVDQIAAGIIKLASNTADRKSMGEISRKTIEHRFSLTTVSKLHESIYYQLLSRGEPRI